MYSISREDPVKVQKIGFSEIFHLLLFLSETFSFLPQRKRHLCFEEKQKNKKNFTAFSNPANDNLVFNFVENLYFIKSLNLENKLTSLLISNNCYLVIFERNLKIPNDLETNPTSIVVS